MRVPPAQESELRHAAFQVPASTEALELICAAADLCCALKRTVCCSSGSLQSQTCFSYEQLLQALDKWDAPRTSSASATAAEVPIMAGQTHCR